jgi:hypothetical protein
MAQGALAAAIKYAKQRKQFGQPISEFQAIQFKPPIWLLKSKPPVCSSINPPGLPIATTHALSRIQHGQTLLAKSPRVANECVQIHGGYGFIKDYPAESLSGRQTLHYRRRHQRNSKVGHCATATW